MLELRDVAVNLDGESGKVQVLQDINLRLDKKMLYVITGPNGGGKSSIAKAIENVIANPKKAKEMAEYGKIYLHDLLNAKKTSKDVYDFYRLIKSRVEY